MSVLTLPLFAAFWVVFTALAVPPAAFFARQVRLPPYLWAGAGCAGVALYGYFAFWLFFIAPWLGVAFDALAIVGSVIWIARNRRILKPSADVLVPLALAFAVGLVYLGTLSLHVGYGSLERAAAATWGLPGDDMLPRFLADSIGDGDDPRHSFAGWLSSDRPPLQAGLVLLQRPFVPPLLWISQGYPLLAVICQLTWVAGVWGLLRTMGASIARSVVALALISSTYFVYLNTVFTWPKMLAGALVLLSLSIVLRIVLERRVATRDEELFAALAAALGVLSHGGVAFVLVSLAAVWLLPVVRPKWTVLARGFMLFVVLLLPWSLYQKLYDPPADRLLKWHLAGIESADDHRAFGPTFVASYEAAGLTGAAANKWANFKATLPSPEWLGTWMLNDSQAIAISNDASFLTPWGALGVLNTGWLVLLALPFLQRRPRETLACGIVLGVCLLGMAFWIAVIFGPHGTVNHTGSYAINLGLAAALALLVTRLPVPLVGLVSAYAAYAYLRTSVLSAPPDELPFGTLGLVSLGIGLFVWIAIALIERPRRLPQVQHAS